MHLFSCISQEERLKRLEERPATSAPQPQSLSLPQVRKDVAVIPLHPLPTDSEVQMDVPPPLGGLCCPTRTRAVQVRSHCPSTCEAHFSLRTKGQ